MERENFSDSWDGAEKRDKPTEGQGGVALRAAQPAFLGAVTAAGVAWGWGEEVRENGLSLKTGEHQHRVWSLRHSQQILRGG